MKFNPPPNWPAPPPGWSPPAGWEPDPSWGPVPAGWQLWIDDVVTKGRPWFKKKRYLIPAGTFVALLALGSVLPDSSPSKSATLADTSSTAPADVATTSSADASASAQAAADKAAADKKAADEKAADEKAAADKKAAAEKAAAEKRAKAAKAAAAAAAKARIDNAPVPSARQWALVVKNPDAYVGKMYVIYGQIRQFDAATGTDQFLADTASRNTLSYGFFDGENTLMTGTERLFSPLVEDDVFKATVQVTGSFSYDTQIGGNTTVPQLKVLRIKRLP